MGVSQKGATYINRSHVAGIDPKLVAALDDIASKVQAVAGLTNADTSGKQSAPSAPTAIAVTTPVAGFARMDITHHGAPAGTAYVIEYSSSPNFLSPVRIDNGISLSFERYLVGRTLYWRAAATFYTSPLSEWTYFGTLQKPTAVSF
jgi:hypothetical protein